MPAKGITVSQGARAEFVPTDVTPRDQVARLIEATLKRFGDIHVLVNNAGVHDSAPFWEESEALWDRMYRVNVLGAVLPSQSVVRHMKERGGGAIVHVASKAGVVGEPGHAAYSASKGACDRFNAGDGGRISALCHSCECCVSWARHDPYAASGCSNGRESAGIGGDGAAWPGWSPTRYRRGCPVFGFLLE
jgi:hypothetical protein